MNSQMRSDMSDKVDRQKVSTLRHEKTTSRRLGKHSSKTSSQTPGKKKGLSCQADWRKKYYMCNPHAYRDSGYSHYHNMALSLNKAS